VTRAILSTDGGSRGNPGPAGAGFVIVVNGETVSSGGWPLPECTNNVAEYAALIWGLENVIALGYDDVHVRTDSELLARQISGRYRVKNAGLKPLFAKTLSLLREFERFEVEHVPREQNAHADTLANEAMDGCCLVGDYSSAPNEGLFDGHCAEADTLIDVGSGGAVPAMSVRAMPADDAGAAGTYGLSVKSHFDAAHHLYDYPGECRALHGHTWDVEVTVESSELDEIGLVYDFKSLKADLAAVLHDYDHALINEIAPFDKVSPTAENLARVICERLQTVVSPRVRVKEVAVWESPVAKLVYRPKVP